MFFDVLFHFSFLFCSFLSFYIYIRPELNHIQCSSSSPLFFPSVLCYYTTGLSFSRFRQASRGPKTMCFSYMDLTFTPFSASSKTLPLQTFLPLPHTRTLSLSKTQKTCYGFWCLHSPATLLTFFQAGYRQIPPREPYPSFFLSESSRASTQYKYLDDDYEARYLD